MSAAKVRRGMGSMSTLAAFVVGVPVGCALLWAIIAGPLHHPDAERYLHHPVEMVEFVMFCGALAALGAKWLLSFREKAALGAEILPRWNGVAVPPAQAGKLLETHAETLDAWSGTWIGRRYLGVLDFVKSRGSANELDDHIHSLADTDAMSLDSSYSLTRFITWAIPILGFLGTVLGITSAIGNVNPDDMTSVTSGLSLAFDATALGLGLTMVLMFVSFLVERTEQGVIERVDAEIQNELGHRFLRTAADHAPLLTAVEESSQRMFDTSESLVRRQSELWGQSLERVVTLGRDAAKEQHKQLVSSLETAVNAALTKHSSRVAEMETQMLARQEKMLAAMVQLAEVLQSTGQKHQQGLTEVSQKLAQQTTALTQLQQGGVELTRLQETLAQNLSVLAGAGAFEEAVQSLTAAIHLLTTRVQTPKKAA